MTAKDCTQPDSYPCNLNDENDAARAVPDLGGGDPGLGADGVLAAVGGNLDDDEGRHRRGQLPLHEADAEALHVLVEAGRGAQAVPADHGVRPGLRRGSRSAPPPKIDRRQKQNSNCACAANIKRLA